MPPWWCIPLTSFLWWTYESNYTFKMDGRMGILGSQWEIDSSIVWTTLGWLSNWTQFVPLHINGLNSPASIYKFIKKNNCFRSVRKHRYRNDLYWVNWNDNAKFTCCCLSRRRLHNCGNKFTQTLWASCVSLWQSWARAPRNGVD